MPSFDSIIEQQLPVKILANFLRAGSIPHALLFTGIEGIGKKTTALAFAMACNCQAPATTSASDPRGVSQEEIYPFGACGACRSCRKILSKHHPDIIHLKPSGVSIRIAQIRELCHIFTMKPYEAQYRVAIIADAHTLNLEAANAFLKMLEEPPEKSLFILIAEQSADLLPTIASRCQPIRFNPLSLSSLAHILVETHAVSSEEALVVASMAQGSVTRAKAMVHTANKNNWINRRNRLVHELLSLSAYPIGRLMAIAERLSKNKDTIQDDLEVIKSWLRDLIVWKYDPDKIINKDLTNKIQYASQNIAAPILLKQFEIAQDVQKKIKANTNPRLTLEIMVLKLANLLT